jgi:hypothetical protein
VVSDFVHPKKYKEEDLRMIQKTNYFLLGKYPVPVS